MSDRLVSLFAATNRLPQLSAGTPVDVGLKIDVLRRRLREHVTPEDRAALLNSLLAKSGRDDIAPLVGQALAGVATALRRISVTSMEPGRKF